MNCSILTHRGLEPSLKNFFPESSIEAFADQLSRGFGLEFDPNFAKDGIVVSHDKTLERITNGIDRRSIHEISISEATSLPYGTHKKGHMPTLRELFELINRSSALLHAMHVKGTFQKNERWMVELVDAVRSALQDLDRMIIFDLTPLTARLIKSHNTNLHLAASVAHPFDISRYNNAVCNTLMTIEDVISHNKLYDWVLLDEWDLTDKNAATKKLHTRKNYDKLRTAGFKIALVTPELHGTSPGLLGGEAHPDAQNTKRLFERIQEILTLKPDAVITDYPEEVRRLSLS